MTPLLISIHALLAESDFSSPNTDIIILDISIHALLAESDLKSPCTIIDPEIFLSTLSLRRATYIIAGAGDNTVYFYPRSPCGERPNGHLHTHQRDAISIHALLAESDSRPKALKSRRCVFLSTLSLRRATIRHKIPHQLQSNFYPRSPCGERLFSCFWCILNLYISIHALLAESDLELLTERLCNSVISIHALLAESDSKPRRLKSRRCVFLSTLSLRRATLTICNGISQTR